jgi:outer membrane protein insertion porin family
VKKGDVYNPTNIDTTIRRMEALALRKGLNFVNIEPRITRNERNQTLDLTFALTRGQRVFVERIDIEGNTTTLDEVIRRQFATVEGDPFNPREIRNSAERLRALGYFSDVQAESRQGSSPEARHRRCQRRGTAHRQPELRRKLRRCRPASASTSAFRNRTSLDVANMSASRSARRPTTRTAQSRSSSPHFSTGISSSSFRAGIAPPTSRTPTTRRRAYGVSPSLEFPVAERTRLELRYTASSDEIHSVSANSSTILQAEAARGALVTSSVGYTLSYDTRLASIDPNSKLLLTFGQDFAGLGGDIESITTSASATYETRILHDDVTLRAEFEGGAVTTTGAGSRIVDRFTGNGKVRGFEANGYGPRDLTAVNQDALGGNLFWSARVETQFPIGLPEEYGLTGGLFADVGSVWGLDNPGTVDDTMHVRSAIGFSIYWTSALGPLRFNFSKAINKETYDKEQTFDLTISTKF